MIKTTIDRDTVLRIAALRIKLLQKKGGGSDLPVYVVVYDGDRSPTKAETAEALKSNLVKRQEAGYATLLFWNGQSFDLQE